MFDYTLILAGGSSTRLWPASSSRLPKQFLPANDKASFFSMAVERALDLTNAEGKVIIITGKPHEHLAIADIQKFSAEDKKRLVIIGEPMAKNTAPAIACGVVYSHLNGGENLLVLTSDHIIKPLSAFKKNAGLAASYASMGKLVAFGIPVTCPQTDYGYIETDTGKDEDTVILNVTAFHEKPDSKTAARYCANKNFFWNSGMFAFSTQFMAEQLRKLAPDVMAPFERLMKPGAISYRKTKGISVLNSWLGLESAYKKTKNISFDCAIAEKCKDSVMVRTTFDWINIGSWEEYTKVRGKNNSIVFNTQADTCYVDSDIPVALAGVDDLIVVIRSGKNGVPASALVVKKDQTQKVRDIVEIVKKSGKTDIL
jgi:mannose-1-phosphate guanylyltransferase/mannose-1-phosphate guanylyltransferase/mannose-6-phosphate isomerase